MKRELNTLTSISLILLFISGLWCASMTAPALSVASPMPVCAQDGSVLEKASCDSSPVSCGFDYPCSFLSKGAFAVRAYSFAKDAQSSTIGVIPLGPSGEISLAADGPGAVSVSGLIQKVPIYVFNSVLTL